MIYWAWLIVAVILGWLVGISNTFIERRDVKRIEQLIIRYGKSKDYFTGFRISHEIYQETGITIGFGDLYTALHNLLDHGIVERKEDLSSEPVRILWKLT